jgi:hypothetical protein
MVAPALSCASIGGSPEYPAIDITWIQRSAVRLLARELRGFQRLHGSWLNFNNYNNLGNLLFARQSTQSSPVLRSHPNFDDSRSSWILRSCCSRRFSTMPRPTTRSTSAITNYVPLRQSARFTAPVEINAAKKFIRRSATISDRTKTPTSMFRSWAASVKLADETKAVRPSMTTHFA